MVEVRPYAKEDEAFVYKSWLESYRSSRHALRIKPKVYFFWHRLLINDIIRRPSARFFVAHVKDEPDVLLGFLAAEMLNAELRVVHYLFVKEAFRRNGVARLLCERAGLTFPGYFTHWTFCLDPMFDQFKDKLTYDPYRA